MDPREAFALELGRVSRRWRTRLDERLKITGLTQARWSTLLHLARGERCMTQRELAERVGIEGPTMIRLLDARTDPEQRLAIRASGRVRSGLMGTEKIALELDIRGDTHPDVAAAREREGLVVERVKREPARAVPALPHHARRRERARGERTAAPR